MYDLHTTYTTLTHTNPPPIYLRTTLSVHYTPKFTVMILPGGNTKITGVDFDLPEGIDTSEWDAKLPEDLQALVKAEKEQAAKKAAKKAKKAADKAAKAK